MEKIAIKVTSREQGKRVIEYLKSLGGENPFNLEGGNVGHYYLIHKDYIKRLKLIPEGYTEAFLPEENETTEIRLPDPSNLRAKAALMCLSFYDVEDEGRFSKAVRDADELIKELNK